MDIDTIMVTRELKKQYRLQYKRASEYLSLLLTKFIASYEDESDPGESIDGPRLMQEYHVP